jgi:hypothetical protein
MALNVIRFRSSSIAAHLSIVLYEEIRQLARDIGARPAASG